MPLDDQTRQVILAAAARHGVSPAYMLRTAEIESSGDPNANRDNGRAAKGLYQFIPSTAQAYGLSDPFDPAASADAAARLARDNQVGFRAKMGRDPSDAELYLTHQQGLGGATALLSNPNAPASSAVGNAAVVQNAGASDMTGGDFADMWSRRFGGGGASTSPPGSVAPYAVATGTAPNTPPGAADAASAAPDQAQPAQDQSPWQGLLAAAQKVKPQTGLLAQPDMPKLLAGDPTNPWTGQGILSLLAKSKRTA